MIGLQRNVVAEMTATLRCVKPAREARQELLRPCRPVIVRGPDA